MKSIWTCGKRKRWSVVENKQNANHMLHSQRPLDVFSATSICVIHAELQSGCSQTIRNWLYYVKKIQ